VGSQSIAGTHDEGWRVCGRVLSITCLISDPIDLVVTTIDDLFSSLQVVEIFAFFAEEVAFFKNK